MRAVLLVVQLVGQLVWKSVVLTVEKWGRELAAPMAERLAD